MEVFDRPETFDPTVDPPVRVEAARLREKLREYYGTDGHGDPFHIDLPKGTYTPQIEFRHEGDPRIAHPEAPPTQDISSTVPAVAVLPFDDLSADQNLGYLGDGVAEDIITALSRFPDLVVVARGSSFATQYRQAWGKGATTLEEYDYYLRGHDHFIKYTKEGIERSGEIWREGLAKFPSSPLLKVNWAGTI